MTRTGKGLVGITSGVVLVVAGVYGWFGDISLFLAAAGLLACAVGVGILVSTQSFDTLTPPHPYACLLIGLAAALHLYENLVESSESFSFGWFIWSLVPYVVVLALSSFRATRVPAVAGAAVALLMDVYVFHSVFIAPKSSTASLALIWAPIWNILILVPSATCIAWLIHRRRQSAAQAP
jgi:hypothetical protein